MRKRHRVVLGVVGTLVLGLGVLLAFVWLGPVTIGDKKLLLDFLLGRGIASPTPELVTRRLHAAPGFRVEIYAGDVPLARWLRFTAAGDLLVARSRGGEVVLLERDRNGDGRPDGQRVLLAGLDNPHGLEIRDGWLYVAETTGVRRVRFDESSGQIHGTLAPIVTGLTSDGFHLTRTIRFGPDGMLYLSQGSSCNVCVEKDTRRATIMRFRPDGTGGEVYATGLRNSVGFDWAPWDGALYATENGRDLLGDDFPPDELNRIERGAFYGWPYVNGFGVPDPDMQREDAQRTAQMLTTARPPVLGFHAHNAPLGIHFLRGPALPAGYEKTALVALHGSWNRSRPDGYKVVALHWREDGSIEERDFLTGFLSDAGIIGRPSDVTEGPDGAIYVADDYAGAIYRISAARQVRAAQLPGPQSRTSRAMRSASTSPSSPRPSTMPARSADVRF